MVTTRRRSSLKKATGRQRSLLEMGRGGFREGAGRKRLLRTKWVRRRGREDVSSRHPVHVNIHLEQGLPRLRNKATWKVLKASFAAGSERPGFRVIHFSVMNNHLHAIVEADDRKALSRGMQGLLIRIARGVNKLWRRTGRVFSDRYHDRALKTPREVRNALLYVLNNAKRNGLQIVGKLDPFASGGWFHGWADADRAPRWSDDDRPTARARSWLMTTGWRRHGPLRVRSMPGSST